MPPNLAKLCIAVAIALIACTIVRAADVTVTPAAGSGFVVKDAAGANERLRVQESGAITLPGLPVTAAQPTSVCMSGAGLLGPCSVGSGGGNNSTYSASTGLNLAGTAFSVAPTYQLPQSCTANQVAQWNGAAWACAANGAAYTVSTGLSLTGSTFSVAPTYQLPQGCTANQVAQWNGAAWSCSDAGTGGATLPAGAYDQTLRYNSSNTLVANNMLLAFADGGLLAAGTSGTGGIPATGAGTRMMWYPGKEAFRAGHVGGSQWDDANVGISSVAIGIDTQASGQGSTAMGSFTTASGTASTALGAATSASGGEAVALGDTTTASGLDSTAMGFTTSASGDFSTAIGVQTVAGGTHSIAIGNTSNATGDYSIALGDHANAMGVHSFIFGDGSSSPNQNFATVDRSFVVYAGGGIGLNGDTTVKGQVTVNNGSEVINDGTLTVYGTTSVVEEYDYVIRGTTHDGIDDGYCNLCTAFPSVYAPNGYMMAEEFDVLSDARIKDIAGLSDSVQDLARLNAIEITNYHMRDKVHFGNRPEKKVIAQQVEQVFPQLVTKHTDFIPDVYKMTNHIEAVDSGYKLSFDTPHGLAATAKKLKLLPEDRKTFEQVDVVSILSPNEVIVRASGWTAERVFVYGEQVDDLRTVDYEGLTALNVSATQELSKRLDAQQTRQAQFMAKLTEKDAQIETLRSDLAAQKARVAALESVAGDLAALNHQFVELRVQLRALRARAPTTTSAAAAYPRRRHDGVSIAVVQP